MGQQTMDVKLEYRSLQTVLTALEKENHSLQEEIDALKQENSELYEHIQQLTSDSRQEPEMEALQRALQRKRKQKSIEEALLHQVRELEALNEKKDEAIRSLEYQLWENSKAWEDLVKEKDQQIYKLYVDLLDCKKASRKFSETDDQIVELKQLLEERYNRRRGTYQQGRQVPKRTGSAFPVQNQVTGEEGWEEELQGASAGETAQVESRWSVTAGQPEVAHAACDYTYGHSNNLVFQGYKVPEEDTTFRWKVCACDRDDCPTCVAERAAMAQSARMRCAKCGKIHHHRRQKHKVPPEAKGEAEGEEDEDLDEETEEEDDYYWGESEDTRQVYVVTDQQKASSPDEQQQPSKCVIYFFHESIRDGTMYDHSCQPKEGSYWCSSCSISALLFAHKYQNYPSGMDPEGVSNELFSQVLDSIMEARENIRLNYDGRIDPLEPTDTLMANAHLGLRLKEEIEPDGMLGLTLVPYIVHIEPGQILLFYRMKSYKVLSMVASADGERILIFDPQRHWHFLGKSKKTKKKRGRYYGACLFSSLREVEVIKDVLAYVEKYCGGMYGKCKLAILEKETSV